MKYNFEFSHDSPGLSGALKIDEERISPNGLTNDLRDHIKNDLKKTEALEEVLNKYKPETPNEILLIGIALGGIQGAERLFNDIQDANLPPALMRDMFKSLVEKAHYHDNPSVSLDADKFQQDMDQEEHEF